MGDGGCICWLDCGEVTGVGGWAFGPGGVPPCFITFFAFDRLF